MADYLTVKEVCKRLGLLDTETVYRYIKQGKLKAYKLGGGNSSRHWRIKPEDLEAFFTGQEPETEYTESSKNK